MIAALETIEPEEARIDGKGTLRKDHGLNILNLEGSFYEMGRQHGALLADQIPSGPLMYYRTYVERMMGRTLGPLSPMLWPTLQKLVGSRIAANLPAFAEQTLRGLADGANVPYQAVIDGATMPDALLWLFSRMLDMRRPGPAIQHRVDLALGCTSAIAWGDATTDGKLLHARNLDYHGVESWPRTSSLLFHAPENGQRYVSCGAAGVPLGGVTAMNEAGLSLAMHQHMFTAEARLGGTPIGLVGDIIMREAKNLDDAERILAAHKPIGCWTYVITDGKSREVLIWEEDPTRNAKRRFGQNESTLGYANIYIDPELGKTEVNFYGSYWRANKGRYRRVNELLTQHHGTIDPPTIAGFLGDTGSERCRIGRPIAMLMTVASVVFKPEDGILWVATGQAPTSHSKFVPFDLKTGSIALEHQSFDAGENRDPVSKEAFDLYRDAYIAYQDDREIERSRALMGRACEKRPKEPLYQMLSGLLALKDGDAQTGHTCFDRAYKLSHDDAERVAAFVLWRGRAADMLGKRKEALRDYQTVSGIRADPPVHRAAKRGLSKKFTGKAARNIQIDFTFADVSVP